MTPAEIRARLAWLREAGEALRRRRPQDVIDALAAVLDRWRDPGGPERRALERELPEAAGFSAPNVREGLARALAPWTGEALRALARRELACGDAGELAVGHETTAVLLAGSIPMPTLLALVAPLALRSPVLAKRASRDPVSARLVARSIAAVDAGLGRCVEVVAFPGSDDERMKALLAADCVVATGSDATVEAVAARVHPPRRLLRHGHRLSVALLGPQATRGDALETASRAIALDAALWDQQGCLSPVAIYVAGDTGPCRSVGAALATALAELEARLPRGGVGPEAAALAAHERSGAELRAAAGRDVEVYADAAGAWTVVCEDDARPRPAPLHRFLRVHPVADVGRLPAALAPLAPHLAGVAVAGFGDGEAALRQRLAALGASRTCRPGELQCPPLEWPRDGLPALAALARDWDPRG